MSLLANFGPVAPQIGTISPQRPQRRARVSGAGGWQNVYEAANRSGFDGYFYIPSLDLGKVLDRPTRDALRERITWLYCNVPPVRMVIDGLAQEEVGTGLWPKWTTENPKFNTAATDGFHYTNHDARFFSADGRDSFYSAQFNIRRLIRLHGDCFAQLLRPAPGSTKPQLHIIPGWRVENFGNEKPGDGWRDGIKTDSLGRALFYRVIGEDENGKRNFRDVPAEDMLHLHDPLLSGQLRGEPALACVAKKMFSREDILAAMTNGTLARERMGFAIQSRGSTDTAPFALPGDGEVTTETAADGSTLSVQKIYGTNARGDISIPEIPDGKELKMVESNRPSAPVREFLDEILRECAWTTTYPPDYVFFIAGLSQGTAVRLVMQRAQTIIAAKREFQLKPFIHRWVIFETWQRIAAGVYDRTEGGIPKDWWKHKIIEPASMTVDLGREGRLYNERVGGLLMSIENFHGLAGEDAADVEDENLAVIRRRLEKVAELNKKQGTNFGYFDLWPRSTSQAPPDPALVEPV